MTLTQSDLLSKQNLLRTSLEGTHNVLNADPYIRGVGFGLKETGGQVDEPPELVFRVYFDSGAPNKAGAPITLPANVLPPLPYPQMCTIDIQNWHAETPPNVDYDAGSYESELVSGLSINSGSSHMDHGLGTGTLGFFATLNSEPDKLKNVVLVSNYHVLIKEPISMPDREFKEGELVWRGKVPVAKIVGKGWKNIHPFTYDGEAGTGWYIDCAAARLIREETSCCKSICPDTWTEFKNKVHDLAARLAPGKITAVARVTHMDLVQAAQTPGKVYKVYKSGRTTGVTEGRVIDVMAPYPQKNVIVIESLEKDGDDLVNFAAKGDSGSALLNAQCELVGMVYAINGKNQTRTYACHIHPVLNYLGVTAVTAANPIPGSEIVADMPFGVDDPGGAHAARLRGAFLDSTGGRRIADVLLAHRSEILNLIHTNRRVTVAWHRHKGPGFINHLVKNVRDPDHSIPQEIDGVTREALIRTMARVLSQHGSAALVEAAANHLDRALDYAQRADSLHDLADALRKEELT